MTPNIAPTFHLGITMAGAVSAGAYTAGFIDYLLEILELWDTHKSTIHAKIQAKEPLNDFEKKIPLHHVCIDAFGGASAGGMVSMMAALTRYKKIEPVTEPTNNRTGNFLYDSWVLLDDDEQQKTFDKMLLTNDIKNQKDGIPSLLNTQVLDRIADRVFNLFTENNPSHKRPNYIAEDTRVLVTLCSLRGIPFEYKFNHISSANFPYSPGHRMTEHRVVAHFKMDFNKDTDTDHYLDANPFSEENRKLLKQCTLATGAFPIGLAPRHFTESFSTEYIKNGILRNLALEGYDTNAVEIKLDEEFYNFTNIDGGIINNEPYAEVVQVLEEKHPNYNPKQPMFGTLMIDPFPNFYNQDEAKPIDDLFIDKGLQNTIWKVLPNIFSSLRNQVRIKHSTSFYKDYLRLLVFPIKWEQNGILKNHPPLACASLGGFGGFLDIEFRKHDYFLGRDNARNFFRSQCMLAYEEENPHPIFQGLTEEAIETFKRVPKKGEDNGTVFMPIIPDLHLIHAKENKETNPFYYTVKDFPEIKDSYFSEIQPKIKHRIKVILDYEINNRTINPWVLKQGLKLTKGFIAKRLTKKVIQIIKKDLLQRNMM